MACGSGRRGVRPLGHRRLVGHEEAVQVAGDEAGGGRLLADNIYYVVPVEVAPLAQELLFAVIVVFGVELEVPGDAAIGPVRIPLRAQLHILQVGDGPAGKGASALLDILLGIISDSHGEEFQQLPAIVLVDGALVVVLVVQPDNHRRVAGQFQHSRVRKLPKAWRRNIRVWSDRALP